MSFKTLPSFCFYTHSIVVQEIIWGILSRLITDGIIWGKGGWEIFLKPEKEYRKAG